MSEVFKNYIDGKWVESVTGETFSRHNPANGELVGVYTSSNATDVDAAVAAGIEFVALGAAVWDDPRGPAAAVADANRRLVAPEVAA